jgi:hypothetical protein
MLQMFHEQARGVGAAHTRSEAGAVGPRACAEGGKVGRACTAAAAFGQAGGQELHALFFDLTVITQANSSTQAPLAFSD